MEQVISIEDLFNMLKKHIKMIVVATIIGLAIAGVATKFFMTPKYEASVDILVNRKTNDNNINQLSDQQADVNMINTYKDIITKSVTLKPVRSQLKEELGYSISEKNLSEKISVTNQQNSQVFSVNVKDSDAARAATTANMIAKTFKQQVKKILDVNNVTIIAKASKPKDPVSPRLKINLVIGVILGLLIGVGFALIREITDHNVRDMEFLTDGLDLTRLGIIGHVDYSSRHQNRALPKIKSVATSNTTSTQLNRGAATRVK